MKLLWTKSKLPAGPLICLATGENVSHFAVLFFDTIVLHSNFMGLHPMHVKEFMKYNNLVYVKDIKIPYLQQVRIFRHIMKNYWGASYDWKWFFNLFWLCIKSRLTGRPLPTTIKWQSRHRFLCTELAKFLEPYIGEVDIGSGTPLYLAKQMGVIDVTNY